MLINEVNESEDNNVILIGGSGLKGGVDSFG